MSCRPCPAYLLTALSVRVFGPARGVLVVDEPAPVEPLPMTGHLSIAGPVNAPDVDPAPRGNHRPEAYPGST